jgi:predicted GTPase
LQEVLVRMADLVVAVKVEQVAEEEVDKMEL